MSTRKQRLKTLKHLAKVVIHIAGAMLSFDNRYFQRAGMFGVVIHGHVCHVHILA